MWLGDCMQRAAFHETSPAREFGRWLHEEQHEWPDSADERFAPICAAMHHGYILPQNFTQGCLLYLGAV